MFSCLECDPNSWRRVWWYIKLVSACLWQNASCSSWDMVVIAGGAGGLFGDTCCTTGTSTVSASRLADWFPMTVSKCWIFLTKLSRMVFELRSREINSWFWEAKRAPSRFEASSWSCCCCNYKIKVHYFDRDFTRDKLKFNKILTVQVSHDKILVLL